MSGNAALDIVIGLVFIYLLYSLYATVIMELIASILGLRARNLSYALRRMLMEEKDLKKAPFKGIFFRVLSSFTRLFGRAINQENPGLFQRFFDQPTIKFLTSGGLGNTPSYISAENFTKALIDSVRVDTVDAGTLVAIEKGLLESKLAEENPQTCNHLLSLLRDANNDVEKFKILVEKWYNDTMERASGWYKQTTQSLLIIIGFFLAFSFNVDTLSIVKKLSKDEDARNQLVNLAVQFSERNPSLPTPAGATPDSAAQANAQAAFEALQATKKSLEDDIRNSQNILSSAWNIPDAISYYPSKFPDKKIPQAQKQIIYTLKAGEETEDVYIIMPQSLDSASLVASFKGFKEDSIKSRIKAIRDIKNKLGIASEKNKSDNKPDTALKTDSTQDKKNTETKVASTDSDEIKPVNKFEISSFSYKWAYFWQNFWGYLLTVLALSLGAPFWFDLLNKLVKLRSSKALSGDEAGEKPEAVADKNLTLRRAG
jgi:hypothetical protein